MMNIIQKDREGVFLVFEGMDGSGKSVVLKEVVKKLQIHRFPVTDTREPGGRNCLLAEQIRKTLLHSPVPITPKAEMYLFAASRAQHVDNFLTPQLNKRQIVISDRFVWSSLIYQGIGRNLGKELVAMINAPAVNDTHPDLTFLFDLPAETAWKRIKQNRLNNHNQYQKPIEPDRFEQEGIQLLQKIRKGYLKLAEENHQAVIVDATQPLETVINEVFEEILRQVPPLSYFLEKRR